MARRTTRRSAARRSSVRRVSARRSYGGRVRSRYPRRRSSTGRAQTVRIVVQGAAPAQPAVMLSEAGKLVAPTSTARSRF